MRITKNGLAKLIERAIREQEEMAKAFSCPPATEDVRLNTENRNAAIQDDLVMYGPMNLSDEDYWSDLAEFWRTDVETAKQSRCGNCGAFDVSPQMQECMPGEIKVPDEESEELNTLGYCWMYDFKCHSARTCRTHVMGGPINDDETSSSWHRKNLQR
jgi:hypothetical protein